MAEENAWWSDSGSSASSSSSCEDNVGNDALYVIWLHGSADTIALFLQDCEVAKVALTGNAGSGKETWLVLSPSGVTEGEGSESHVLLSDWAGLFPSKFCDSLN